MPGNVFVSAQENTNTPERTPEQEAALQTEKIQQELNLTANQVQQVHEINLKYARERQVSNSRSEALQRIKKKEQDLRRVLKPEQYNQLQNKQYERSSSPNPAIRRTTPANSSSFRDQNTEPVYRTGPRVRQPVNGSQRTINDQSNVRERNTQPTQRSTNDDNRQTVVTPPERKSGGRNTITTPATRQTTPTTTPARRTETQSPASKGSDTRSTEKSTDRTSNPQTPTRTGSSNSGRR